MYLYLDLRKGRENCELKNIKRLFSSKSFLLEVKSNSTLTDLHGK
jgi:hypothetical protein